MSFLISPQTPEPAEVFNTDLIEARRERLTNLIIEILVKEDLQNWALEHRKAFAPSVPLYPLDEHQIKAKFYTEARKEAERILEAEKQNVVDQRAEYIGNTLKIVVRQLQMLTLTDHGKGKLYVEKKLVPERDGTGYIERDVMYFESYPEGVEHAEQIGRVSEKLSSIRDYIPYLNAELAELWKDASDLVDLKIVRKEEHTEIAETEERTTEKDKAEV